MGYYITFVFDPAQEKYDHEKLIKRFIEAGASFIEDPGYEEDGGLLVVANHPLAIGDYPPRSLKKGYYADVRFSWGTDPVYLFNKLAEILDVAERVGCRVYDGQLDLWITRENLKDIADGFAKSACSIGNLFGGVDEKIYGAATEKVLKEINNDRTGSNVKIDGGSK